MFSIQFNSAKCVLLYFKSELNPKCVHSNVFMFGEKIQSFNKFKYLGHTLSTSRNILTIDTIINEIKTKKLMFFLTILII